MDILLLTARAFLATVLLVAGFAKISDRSGSVRSLQDFGVPRNLAPMLGFALPLIEVTIAIGLLLQVSSRWAGLAALILILCFIIGTGNQLLRGATPECHCFGRIHSAPIGWSSLIRNGLLAAIAGFVAVAGWSNPGSSAFAWLANTSNIERILLLGVVGTLFVLGCMGWILVQIMKQNGRLLDRIETLEAARPAGTAPVEVAKPTMPEKLLLGSPAPDFSLRTMAGRWVGLADLLTGGRSMLLIFADPKCKSCTELLPEVERWQHAGLPFDITIITTGTSELSPNYEGTLQVLVQEDREVATAFHVKQVPATVLVSKDGVIASRVVTGPEEIRRFVELAMAEPFGRPQAGRLAGSQNRTSLRELNAELELSTLDGEPTLISRYFGQPLVTVFWNPDCRACQRMLPDLLDVIATASPGAPKLLIVSSGDRERTRSQAIPAPVLLDPDARLGRFLGVTGTPSAVHLDQDGVVTSQVMTGAPAILKAIAGADPDERMSSLSETLEAATA